MPEEPQNRHVETKPSKIRIPVPEHKGTSNQSIRFVLISVCFILLLLADSAIGIQIDESLEIPNTQKLEVPFTSAADALAGMKLPQGFKATLFANEPDVHQPIAVTTDAKGRLWVAECYTYSDRAENYNTELNDRILIFEDQDNDGHFDSRKVFWDGGKKLTGIEVGFGGVWVTCAPEFLFIPDRNGDDVPDGEPEVLLDGFEDNVIRHNIVNGLRWGPDGWLYGRHGIQATSFVGPPDATESQRTPMNCAIWRYHPTHKKFEVVAQGGTNPWGFDYDEHGEMFMINTVIGHLFHIVPNARYRRMYGAHFNPHTYQVIEQTADHFHWDVSEEHWAVTKKEGMSDGTDAAGGGHAHTGLMIYQGDNWPRQYRNALFTANFHGRRLNVETIHRGGNSYVAHHGVDFMKTDDPWFRGVEMIYGPDGGVFLLDWSDIGECHENDGIHRTSGRIFKITYGESPELDRIDLAARSDEELIDLLTHSNEWHVRKARRLLQERSLADGADSLESKLKQKYAEVAKTSVKQQLRLMWAIYSTGNADEKWLIKQSFDKDEHVRAWAVRMLSDGLATLSESTLPRFVEMAATDSSGLVRLYLASALPRLSADSAFPMADRLCDHLSDQSDRVQPHLIWYGIEPFVVEKPQRALCSARRSKIPLIRQNVVRRLTSEFAVKLNPGSVGDPTGSKDPLANDETVSFDLNELSDWIIKEPDSEIQRDVVQGMAAALDGWIRAESPSRWEEAATRINDNADAETKQLLSQINIVFGSGRTLEQLEAMARNQSAAVTARRAAIAMLGPNLEPGKLFDVLKSLINDKSVTTQVTKSMVHCTDRSAAKLILGRFNHMQPEGKSAAINTLVARSEWTRMLLKAVEEKKVPSNFISAFHARQIKNFADPKLSETLARVWGEIRESSAEKTAQMERVKDLVYESLASNADAENGRQLFKKHCASCHILYREGGKIGPDLTGSDRKNLNYLLENLIDPSASVAEAYRSSVLELEDGRLISGIVVADNGRILKIQTKDELLTIDRDSIEQSRKTKLSLMPDGILDPLPDKDVVDLFRYLMGNSSPN